MDGGSAASIVFASDAAALDWFIVLTRTRPDLPILLVTASDSSEMVPVRPAVPSLLEMLVELMPNSAISFVATDVGLARPRIVAARSWVPCLAETPIDVIVASAPPTWAYEILLAAATGSTVLSEPARSWNVILPRETVASIWFIIDVADVVASALVLVFSP
jgi:hypothetical protein